MMSVLARAPAVLAVSARAPKTTTSTTTSIRIPARVAVAPTRRTALRRHRRSAVIAAMDDDTPREVVEPVVLPPSSASKPAAAPAGKSTPGKGTGKTPVDPKLLAAGDFVAAVTAVCIARGAAGQDVASAGTVISIAPFAAGWLGAGAFSGDYDADSPNEALQGNIPRAMSTGAFTWHGAAPSHYQNPC